MTVTEAIKKALKDAGISESHAERVQKAFGVKAADGAEAAVQAFKENLLPAIEEAGKEARTKAAEEARKAAVADYEKAHGLKDGKPITPAPTDPIPQKPLPTGEINGALREWVEAQNKQLQELRAEITRAKTETANAARQSEVKAAIQKAGLPESWITRINAEAPIEEQVKTLGEEYTAIRQDAINQSVAGGNPYTPPKEDTARTEADWATLMNENSGAESNQGTAPLFDAK